MRRPFFQEPSFFEEASFLSGEDVPLGGILLTSGAEPSTGEVVIWKYHCTRENYLGRTYPPYAHVKYLTYHELRRWCGSSIPMI